MHTALEGNLQLPPPTRPLPGSGRTTVVSSSSSEGSILNGGTRGFPPPTHSGRISVVGSSSSGGSTLSGGDGLIEDFHHRPFL